MTYEYREIRRKNMTESVLSSFLKLRLNGRRRTVAVHGQGQKREQKRTKTFKNNFFTISLCTLCIS